MPPTFIVTLKPLDHTHGETESIPVSPAEAKRIGAAWDAHENVLIGDRKVSWQRILEITAPPLLALPSASPWCGQCEAGWRLGEHGAYPCSCNHPAHYALLDYHDYLQRKGRG